MNKKKKCDNTGYIKALSTLTKLANEDKYMILGSVATLSYTNKVGYDRQIHDIDVIMDKKETSKISKKLIQEGYTLKTFIDKRMPFYKSLIKQANSHYFRFTKNEIAIEILSTEFKETDKYLKFDLYPNIWVQIPKTSVVEQELENVPFTTLEVNLIWGIKQFLNNTLGRIMKYKKEQRESDLVALKSLANVQEVKKLLSKCRLGYRGLKLRIPTWII